MLALVILWAPTLLALIFLVAAGILFARVRSPVSGVFFAGALVTTLAPWAFQLIGSSEYSAEYAAPLVMILAFTVQVLGFLFYALSVPRKTRDI